MPAHRAAILVHTFLSAASRSTFPQLLLTLLRSFLKVLLQVIFGLPLFLLPRRSCHFISTFAGQSSDILRMWPANLTLCSVTISCRRRDCALLITLSFVIWSRYDIFRIFRKHPWWKTSNFFQIAAVDFQVSLAQRAVDSTICCTIVDLSSC